MHDFYETFNRPECVKESNLKFKKVVIKDCKSQSIPFQSLILVILFILKRWMEKGTYFSKKNSFQNVKFLRMLEIFTWAKLQVHLGPALETLSHFFWGECEETTSNLKRLNKSIKVENTFAEIYRIRHGFKTRLGNVRPSGHMRPAKLLYGAHGHFLSSQNIALLHE